MIETTFQLTLLGEVPPLAPMVILALCVIAGIGTVLLLPSRREASIRGFGGVMLIAAGGILAALLIRWTAGSAEGGMGLYFWIFSTIAIGGAIRVITHTRPVYSALYFVLTVFASAGLFLLLRAEFMAAALVLIYAGAILITYVFVIMLAAEVASPKAKDALAEHDAVSRDPIFACAIGFAMMGVILFVIFDKYQAVHQFGGPSDQSVAALGSTQQLGAYLFTNQLINVELAGLILTVAMVGAIVIARRKIEDEDMAGREFEEPGEIVLGPATPIDDDPHSIPVYGTTNPSQKAYPET
jgi:NADH-quinone oxidoreductase subunit J